MNYIKAANSILLEEGIINYVKRKLNITYLDSKKTHTINYRGKKIKILLNRKFGHVDMMVFKHGIYEKEIVDDIVNELDKDKVMVDIGANIGQHSLISAPFCKEVHAFEPIPEVYSQFKKSIEKNSYTNLFLYNLAIGNKKETKQFHFLTSHAGASGFVKNDDRKNEFIDVNVDTLQNILGEKKVDVMKIDVEGFEGVVIFGNKDFILKNRPIIFMEFAPRYLANEGSYSGEELFNFFLDNGYSIYSRANKKYLTSGDHNLLVYDNWILKPI